MFTMDKSNKSLENGLERYENFNDMIRRGRRDLIISTVLTLMVSPIGLFAGIEIGTYINRKINPKPEESALIEIQKEQNPHKYTIKKAISGNPHHYVVDSE